MDKVYFRVTYDDGSISFYSSIAYLQTPTEMLAKLNAGSQRLELGAVYELTTKQEYEAFYVHR